MRNIVLETHHKRNSKQEDSYNNVSSIGFYFGLQVPKDGRGPKTNPDGNCIERPNHCIIPFPWFKRLYAGIEYNSDTSKYEQREQRIEASEITVKMKEKSNNGQNKRQEIKGYCTVIPEFCR